MIHTSDTSEWLAKNRRRSYPMQRDKWREVVAPTSGLDCVLLDAMLFDADSGINGVSDLVFDKIVVSQSQTSAFFKYAGRSIVVTLSGGETSGDGSFDIQSATIDCGGNRLVAVSFAFSSHAYILNEIGEGEFGFGCPVLVSRIARLTDGYGVDGIATNGSSGVDGHSAAKKASGDVVLEDGYRTSPILIGGRVLVRVGKRYGPSPCEYDYGDDATNDCRRPLFFFCGQNAVRNGNVVLRGGRGVVVTQGRKYSVRDENSKANGLDVPCIEVSASQELLDLYRPEANDGII